MTGEHVRDDLGLYALGLLDRDERAAVERHLASCLECRAELDAHERTVGALAAAIPARQGRDMRDTIVGRHRPARWQILGLPRPVAAAALAALALFAIGVATIEDVVTLERPGSLVRSGAVIVARGGAAFLVLNMPEVPEDVAYEAWVIRDGRALPAGVGPAGRGTAVIRLERAPGPGEIAAVTIERASGASEPTSDPILIGTRKGS